jgi:hypothetical protein
MSADRYVIHQRYIRHSHARAKSRAAAHLKQMSEEAEACHVGHRVDALQLRSTGPARLRPVVVSIIARWSAS